jgi:hypothetical protein
MKTRNLIFLCFLVIGAGCSSSTSTNSNFSFTNTDASYTRNVSGIYELAAYGTVGTWTQIDIKWKDSNDYIRAMSGYGNANKPILLSFWATTPTGAALDEFSLDSTQTDLGDSVGIVTIAEGANFQTVYRYDTLNKIGVQIVVDSGGLAQLQYSQLEDGSLGQPETFVLKPNGTIMADEEGYVPARVLDSLVRAAYH